MLLCDPANIVDFKKCCFEQVLLLHHKKNYKKINHQQKEWNKS